MDRDKASKLLGLLGGDFASVRLGTPEEIQLFEENLGEAIQMTNVRYPTNGQDKRNYDILRKTYGIETEALPVKEIAGQYFITPNRVRQINNRSVRRLKHTKKWRPEVYARIIGRNF